MSDVLVIGGGIVGLACASEIAARGGDVAVCDPRPGGEASWAAGGILGIDYEFNQAGPFADFAAHSRALWNGFAARVAPEWAELVKPRPEGTLVPAATQADLDALRARFAWNVSRGSVEFLDAAAAREKESALPEELAGAAWLTEDGPVNNRAVLLAQLGDLRARGVEMIGGGKASLVVERGSVKGAECNGERHEARIVVLAAGAWASFVPFGPDDAALPSVIPVRGQMLGFTAPRDSLRHVVRWAGGYAVPRGDRIVVGATVEPGSGFDKGMTADGRERLASGFRETLPGLSECHPATHAWAGLRPCTADGMPVIGPLPGLPGLLLAVGHYRNGILLAPATAVAIADFVEGKTPRVPVAALAPGRDSLQPRTVSVNGDPHALLHGMTVGALLEQMAMRRPGVAVAVNEEVVRRGEWDTRTLSGGDRIEIIHAVGGG